MTRPRRIPRPCIACGRTVPPAVAGLVDLAVHLPRLMEHYCPGCTAQCHPGCLVRHWYACPAVLAAA